MYRCPKCDETFDQPVNFCRKCGAAMATAPLSEASTLATQEMSSVQTNQLGVEIVTATIKKADANDAHTATLPAKPIAETAVLDSAAKPTLAEPLSEAKTPADSTPADSTLESPTQKNSVAAMPSAASTHLPATALPAKASNKLGLIGIAAVVLCALLGGAYYLMRPAAVTPVVETTSNITASSEPQSNANATVTTDPANNAPLVATPGDKSASPRPTSSPLAGKTAASTPEGNATAPTPASAYGTELPMPTDKAETNPAKAESGTNYLAQGTQFLSARQFPEAIAAFQKAHKAEPSNIDLHYLMGSAYHQLGQLNEALAQYKQCTSGSYAAVAANHVKNLEKKLKKGQ